MVSCPAKQCAGYEHVIAKCSRWLTILSGKRLHQLVELCGHGFLKVCPV